jgi:signal transduction histidine kinase
MKVRTSLFFLSVVFVIIIVVLGYVMFNSSNLVNNEVRESKYATQIIKDVFELNIVTYEYLTYHEERMHQQWLIKYGSLGELLDWMRTEESHTEHVSILESITSDYESLGNLFSLLQENLIKREKLIEENKPQAEIDLSLSSEKRLSSQALIRSQRMASEAFIFSALMEQRIAQVQQRTNSIALFSIISFIVLSFSISFLTSKAITGPLNELVKSAEIIGKGNLNHKVNIETRNEIGELAVAFNQMTEKRQQVEERIIHLNRVLHAIRNVNQLITKERDLDRLIESVCDRLIETDSYGSAWILLLNEDGTPSKFSRKDITGHSMSLSDLREQGEILACTQAILAQAGVQIIKDGADICQDCFLVSNIPGSSNTLVARLEYNGVIYGAINVAVLKEYAIDAEEIALFAELAGDISFALFSIELETDRKRAEEKLKDYTEGLEVIVEERTQELRDAQESLVRQERLAVLGQLAGGVGHELRNPLGVISNAVYYLQTVNPDADESTQEYLNMISSEVQNAGKIISDLLDFSRTRMPERQEIGVSELVAQVLERKPPPENVQVSTEFPEDLPEVYVDSAQINQVLINLVVNAYQAMLEGGKLVIKAEVIGDEVRLAIKDNGIGISPENMKKLFEPLFTTKPRGIGLGLAVSKTLLETNGGSIEVESEEGAGSTFKVNLPNKERTS